MKCELSAMTDAIRATSLSAGVTIALKRAAQSSGVSFDYLYRVAKRESALNPTAKAKTSSAAGLFQFIDQTWLAAVKKYGALHGLSAYAADIDMSSGKPSVADGARRQEILNLRFDPEKAAALAAQLARENRTALKEALGRTVGAAELYAAHFLGAGGAKKLLSAKAEESAAALLPAAAKANRPVFYEGARERTVAEVIESFKKTIGGAAVGFGERIEKSFAPFWLETAAYTRALLPRETGAAAAKPMEGALATSPAYADEARPLSRASHGSSPRARSAQIEDAPAARSGGAGYAISSLSPLILAVLQTLDPRDTTRRDRE